MKFEPRRPASPAVRKLARTLGVDIEVIAGTGPGGRVRMEDVQNAAGTAHTRSVDAAPGQSPSIEAPHSPPRVAGPAAPGRVPPPPLAESREPLSLLRLRVAEVMTESVRTIPHVTDCNDADVTDLDRLRRGWNGTCAEPDRLGMLPFVLSAVARALREHTIFNASLDDAKQEVIHHGHVSIAVGMQTPRGLVAPVVRSADRLSILEIHRELARLTEKCRAGRFETADALGATYTISNAGAIGPTRYSTPIITPPQVAVLAVGRSRQMPWVVDGAVVPRLIMPLSHSMDHRVIDGAVEIAFIASVIGLLENPASLLIS